MNLQDAKEIVEKAGLNGAYQNKKSMPIKDTNDLLYGILEELKLQTELLKK